MFQYLSAIIHRAALSSAQETWRVRTLRCSARRGRRRGRCAICKSRLPYWPRHCSALIARNLWPALYPRPPQTPPLFCFARDCRLSTHTKYSSCAKISPVHYPIAGQCVSVYLFILFIGYFQSWLTYDALRSFGVTLDANGREVQTGELNAMDSK